MQWEEALAVAYNLNRVSWLRVPVKTYQASYHSGVAELVPDWKDRELTNHRMPMHRTNTHSDCLINIPWQ